MAFNKQGVCSKCGHAEEAHIHADDPKADGCQQNGCECTATRGFDGYEVVPVDQQQSSSVQQPG